MGDAGKIVIWTSPPVPSRAARNGLAGAGAVPAEIVSALESKGFSTSVHEGSDPPGESCDVILRWAETDAPEAEASARLCLRSGRARAVVIAAAGASGPVSDDPAEEGAPIIRADPAWGADAIATIAKVALTFEKQRAYFEDLAESREDLVTIASHDLRTPVSTLRLLQDIFRSNLDAKSEQLSPRDLSDFDELLGIMERNLDKMEALTEDIIEAWCVSRGRPEAAREPVSLNSVVEDVVTGLFPSAMRKDIALDLVTEPSLGPVMAESRRVAQVVANLVGNAVKYTPPGGTVTVRTRAEEGGVLFEVADTGPGIPEEERGRLFQRFSRGSARATGGEPSTGLGLFICREILEQHGGRAWFEPRGFGPAVSRAPAGPDASSPETGSRFLAFWPFGKKQGSGR